MTTQQKEADERLLIEAAQTDPRHFADLYERYFDRVYAFVARRVRNREAAEDITSEVFHQALANVSTFEWRGTPFVAWLYRIAHYAVLDRQREAARETTEEELDFNDRGIAAEAEHRAILFQLVNQLPNDQRRVITARFVEQKSIRDIAHELKRTEGAIKQLQLRALRKLRTLVGRADA